MLGSNECCSEGEEGKVLHYLVLCIHAVVLEGSWRLKKNQQQVTPVN